MHQTSTSAPTREGSPFVRRYLQGGEATGPVTSQSDALGRRLSLSQAAAAGAMTTAARARAWTTTTTTGEAVPADELSIVQLVRMVRGLVETVDRLEKKLEVEKGKGREVHHGGDDDESAIDDEDEDDERDDRRGGYPR